MPTRPLPPPAAPLPRRIPGRTLPPYRYVPGLQPHPFRHPGGHLYTDGRPPAGAPWSADLSWQEDIEYLWGMDLFDGRYYWEAHEVWEAIWHQVPREDPYSWLLQGLIQAAASLLKGHQGHPEAAARLMARATARIEAVESARGPLWRGLDLPETLRRLRATAPDNSWPTLPSL